MFYIRCPQLIFRIFANMTLNQILIHTKKYDEDDETIIIYNNVSFIVTFANYFAMFVFFFILFYVHNYGLTGVKMMKMSIGKTVENRKKKK